MDMESREEIDWVREVDWERGARGKKCNNCNRINNKNKKNANKYVLY